MRKNIFSTVFFGFLTVAIPAAAANQDLVIVSIGDSVASGEGNPNSFGIGGAVWSNAPCHRSVNNGRRFASNRINNLDGVSTTFFDFSCSAASIDFGLLGSQATNQPDANNAVEQAQIDRVAHLQQTTLNNKPIDILMISIGGNDANFPGVATACLLPTDCTHSDAMNTARDVISHQLADRYDRLAAAIQQQLNVRHVYITSYPNMVTSRPNDFCGDFDDGSGDLSMAGVSATESQFVLENFIRPLNTRIQEAAARNHFNFVAGVEDTFATHGFCTGSGRRYVNTLADSFIRQGNQKGTVHPNVGGHSAYADALVSRATLDFNLPLETPRVVRTVESNVGIGASVAVPAVRKAVTVEIAQHPGALSVTLQHRVLTPFVPAPDFSNTAMTDSGDGRLNLFSAQIPGSEGLLPFQTLQYRVAITATRNGNTASTTTAVGTIVLGEGLVQQ